MALTSPMIIEAISFAFPASKEYFSSEIQFFLRKISSRVIVS